MKSKFAWEERVKGRRYSLKFDNGLYFEVLIIDPERKNEKIGQWPYALEYHFKGIDCFGLGTYGSSVRLETLENLDSEVEKLIGKYGENSADAISISKLGTRSWQLGLKYMVKFTAPGLFHHGTYFESFNDIETWLKVMKTNGEGQMDAKVYFSPAGEAEEYLGEYTIKTESGKKTIGFQRLVE